MEYSPWGDGADDSNTKPHRPASPDLPAFSFAHPTNVVPESDDWTDDGGGWGGALEYSVPFTSSSEIEAGREDIGEVENKQVRAEEDGRGGWGDAANDLVAREAVSDQDSPDPDTPSTIQDTASSESPTSPTSRYNTNVPAEDVEDDWGNHGHSPTLPPIADVRIDSDKEELTPRRDSGWGNESEWQPEELPPPLPSFGSSFSARSPSIREARETESESQREFDSGAGGWDGAVTQASWEGDEGELVIKNVDGAWNKQTPLEPPRVRSIVSYPWNEIHRPYFIYIMLTFPSFSRRRWLMESKGTLETLQRKPGL